MPIEDLISDTVACLEQALKNLKAFQAHRDREAAANSFPSIKKPNGRLTDAGVQQLYSMIEAGYSDGEIAHALDITQPAVPPHRRRYLAANPKRRQKR